MKRKLIIVGIVLVGFVLALGGNLWAGEGSRLLKKSFSKEVFS